MRPQASLRRHAPGTFFALLALITAGPAAAQQAGAPKVRVATATVQRIAPQIEVPGTVISRNDARLAVDVAGTVDWIAEVGSVLQAGDVLARLDDTLRRLEVSENQAIVRRLEADLKYQTQELNRLTRLVAKQTVSQARVDEVTARRDMTQHDLDQAKARLERSQYQLSRSDIRTPFPGTVAGRLVELGEYAAVGTEIARVVDTAHLDIRAQVPLTASPYLSTGTLVHVDVGAGPVESPVRAMVPVGDEVTRTFELRISAPDPGWVVGSAVRVRVPTGTAREVVSVPRDAVVLRAENSFVFCVESETRTVEDGATRQLSVARRVVVRTGAGHGAWIEIASGAISEGDTVIVRGAESLQPGQIVDVLGNS